MIKKIFKKIFLLIPFLIISLSIKNVYAEDLYYNTRNYSTDSAFNSFTTTLASGYTNLFNYNILDNNINISFIAVVDYDFFIFKSKDNLVYSLFIVKKGKYNSYNIENDFLFSYEPDVSSDYPITIDYQVVYFYNDINNYNSVISNLNFPYYKKNQYYLNNDNTLSSIQTFQYDYQKKFIFSTFFNYFDYYYSTSDLYKDKVLLTREVEPEEPEDPISPTYNLDKIFVPNYHEGQCVEIIDKDTIRVFENEETNIYNDYYINSHYISKSGQTEQDYVKSCSSLEFTNIRYYGNDFPQILFILVVIIIFSVGFPYILFKRFKKR